MSIDEFLLLIISGIFTYKFLLEWYRYTRSEWPPERVKIQRVVFCLLPVISFAMIFFTLKELASFDVVNDGIYLFLYILFGFAWIYICFSFIFRLFDVSWKDDVLNNNNKAALFAMTGAFLGITAVYCGANTGDGPGWWCVLFAGGLGMIAWFILGMFVNGVTKVSERITVGRDLDTGIRFGCFLLAAGLFLARASAGDWTSFLMTVVEFADGWPVLPLTIVFIVIEFYYMDWERNCDRVGSKHSSSIFLGVLYVAVAIVCMVLLPPPKENPQYSLQLGAVFQWIQSF